VKGVRYDKMAVDFGTSNTVVAFWDDAIRDVVHHHIPDVTLSFRYRYDGREMDTPYIPSLIYYQDRKTTFVGYQVIQKMLENSRGAFRWMKAYIQSRCNMKYPLADGSEVTYTNAGKDFLEKVLSFVSESGHVDLSSCEVAFTVTVESFEHYTDWLSEACLSIGVRRYRFIDEPSACIFGYDTHLQAGDIFLIFDFGGGTLDVSVVRIEDRVEKGRGCRVMGKAGCTIGGRTIDGWLYADLLGRARIHDIDAKAASGLLMLNVEAIKERLSSEQTADYDISHKVVNLRIRGTYTRGELEELLERKGLYRDVQETIERAIRQAELNGIVKADIKEALLVGGTSLVPSIRRMVATHFSIAARSFHLFDTVARGACRYLTEDVESLYDHIQHHYAVKSYNHQTGSHEFIPLVPRGTHYPTALDFRTVTIKATRDAQRFFGIDIYEIAGKESACSGIGELIFDPSGCAVFDASTRTVSTEFWMNEDKTLFIEADPPGKRGEPRFRVVFRVDSQKRLLVTVRDILTQRLLYHDHPVVKLK
jgi:molecular chaperone DnaK